MNEAKASEPQLEKLGSNLCLETRMFSFDLMRKFAQLLQD